MYNNDPWIDTPVATLEDNRLKVMVDIHTMNTPFTIDLTYIAFPPIIDSSSPSTTIDQVPDRILYEVIDRAVALALENIESKRTESKMQLNNLSE